MSHVSGVLVPVFVGGFENYHCEVAAGLAEEWRVSSLLEIRYNGGLKLPRSVVLDIPYNMDRRLSVSVH